VARNRARPRRGYPGAFTLLEVILAVSLTVGLVLAVLAFYDHATGVRRTLMQDVQLISAERNVMDKITDELRSAIAYPFLNVGMEGQNDQMRFIIASLPGPAAWAVAKPGDQPVQPEQDLEWVGYRLRTYEDDQGVIQIAGLERTSRKTLAAEGADESKVVQASLISPQIRFLRLRYWSGSDWAGSYRRINGTLEKGYCLITGTNQGAEHIPRAPRSLLETTRILRASAIARDWLGDTFVEHFAATREWECRQWQDAVTDWEMKRYFEII
jgi:type II secretory pathway component PulJ